MSQGAELIGKYRLLGLIATGGMGEVWLATQTGPGGFERKVVVKRVLRELAYDPEFVRLFLEEARLAALLSHPNVVQVIELGEERGQYFIAMEHVRGVTFRALARRCADRARVLPPQVVAALGAQVCHALHAAHTLVDAAGAPVQLVHRDVTPDNIMLAVTGQVKVLDFGVAKALARSGPKTLVARGKVPYMAPEQLAEGHVSPQSDIFSLGLVLKELAKGQEPSALSPLLDRATAPDRAERFQSAQLFAGELEAVAAALGVPGPAALGALVVELFPERLRDDEPLRPGTAVIAREPAPVAPPSPSPLPSAPRRRVWPWAAGMTSIAAGVLLGLFMKCGPEEPIAVAQPEIDAGVKPVPPPPPPPDEPPDESTLTYDELKLRPTAQRGRVILITTPWADVFFRGKNIGQTPTDPIELPVGTNTLVFRNPVLGLEKKMTVRVKSGSQTLNFDLMK